ncbi:PAS domain-containing protein [Spirosoma aerophilum]
MAKKAHDYLKQLLPLFNHAPVAIAEIDAQGLILQANPKAIQLLIPLAMRLNLSGHNLLDILIGYLPTASELITSFSPSSGLVIDQEPYRLQFVHEAVLIERYFSLTVEKMDTSHFLVFFDDVTDFLTKADTIRQHL